MRRAGFTLLEMLLALALVALLSGGIFGFLFNVLDRRDRLMTVTSDAQSIGAFFELVEADVACAIAGDAALGAGVRGDGTSLRLLSRRVWAPMRASERDSVLGDLQVTEYRFSGGRLNVRRWPAASEPGAAGRPEAISDRVQALRLRYFDGERWAESFDSAERGQLPVAIEIAVWLGRSEEALQPVSEEEMDDNGGSARMQRAPDRLRIVAVPDGPTTWWRDVR